MRRIMRRLALAGVITLVATAITSCDSAERVSAPGEELSAQYSPGQSNARFRRVLASVDFGGTVSVSVDAVGGMIELQNGDGMTVAALYVQPGTVRNNTTFTIVASDVGGVYVHLEATSQGSRIPNDVGMKGFKKPVYLMFNLQALSVNPADLSRLTVAELQDNGKIVPARSWQSGGWLYAMLPHFSGWVPVLN